MINKTGSNILKRLLSSLTTIFFLITFIFFLVRIAPGDPAQKYLSPKLSPELAEQVTKSFNLNDPLIVQYFSFIKNAAIGDLGISYNYRLPVLEVIMDYLPFTIIFALIVFIIQLLLSLFLSIKSVKKVDGVLDKILTKSSMIFFVTPVFVVGLFLILLFSVWLNLFPSSGISSYNSFELSFFERVFDFAHHLILPVSALAIGGTAVFYRYLRDNIISVYQEPFVINLRANGYTEKQILRHHILPNAINPLISIAGIELGLLLGGTLITEVIFALPGFGRLMINAITLRDYPLIVGCSIIASTMIIFSNFAADIIKVKLDKRMAQEING